MELKKTLRLITDIRIQTIRTIASIGFGHIGGSMSICDVLGVLYGDMMHIDPQNPQKEDRDFFVLSKGHCGPAIYATLALKGYFPLEELDTLNRPGTRLPSHCDRLKTPGIDMSTGSLGQGVSSAIGIALGNKQRGLGNYTYLIVGDGELQEGQVWEGAMFAAAHKLDHLITFVDGNKRQLDGRVKDICNMGEVAQKFSSFGFHVQEVNGHDAMAIYQAIENAKNIKGVPHMILLDTEKGYGCSFAEKVEFNHYMVVDEDMAREAVSELERRYEEAVRTVI